MNGPKRASANLLASALLVAGTCVPAHRAMPPKIGAASSEFELIATTLPPEGGIPAGLPLLTVDPDPHFQIFLRVDRIVSGASPFAEGARFVLFIHSPTLTYVGRSPELGRYRYRFRTERTATGLSYGLVGVEPN